MSGKPAIPTTKRKKFEVNEDGIIKERLLWDGWTEVYSKTVDLKGFLKELNAVLLDNKIAEFTDMLGDDKKGGFFEHFSPKGEFTKSGSSQHLTRQPNMFETHHVWAKHEGYFEFETFWYAKCNHTKYSGFGWITFKLDLVARFITEVEVDGKKMLKADWEFRNEFFYFNNYITKYLHTLPIVKDSAKLQQLMIDHVYYANLERDIDWVDTKVRGLIWGVIEKHFK